MSSHPDADNAGYAPRWTWQRRPVEPEELACNKAIIDLAESECEAEVSRRLLANPSESRTQGASPRGPSGLDPDPRRADQIKPLTALEAIAIDIRGLPYGEFMEMAEGIEANPDTLWKWAQTHGRN